LLSLPGVPFQEVLRHLPPRERIKLRLVSRTLKEKFDFFDATVRSLHFKERQLTCAEVISLADDLARLEGLTVARFSPVDHNPDVVVQHLATTHPELKVVKLVRASQGERDLDKESYATDAALSSLLALPTIHTIHLRFNRLTGLDLCPTPSLAHLQDLDVSFGECLTDAGIYNILQRCGRGLKSLNISKTGVTDDGLLALMEVCSDQLHSLHVGYTGLGWPALADFIRRLSRLQTIGLNGCSNLSDADLCDLIRRWGTRLKVLDLTATELDGDSLESVSAPCRYLESLNVFLCRHLSDRGLYHLLRIFGPSLTSLDLSQTEVTGVELAKISRPSHHYLASLESLKLINCRGLTDAGLCSLLTMCGPRLKVLKLSLTNVTGESLAKLAKPFEHVENLDVSACRRLTNAGLCQLLRLAGGSALTYLALSATTVHGEGLTAKLVSSSCSFRLETLKLSGCRDLTDHGLLELLTVYGPSLKTLDASFLAVKGTELTALGDGHLANIERLTVTPHQLSAQGLKELLRICGPRLKQML